MKKFLIAAVLVVMGATAMAQAVEDSKFTDNFSITLKGGGVSAMKHYAFFGNMRGAAGIELRKQITPVFGLGIEGEWTFGTSNWNKPGSVWGPYSCNIVDHQLVGMFGTVNMMNLFGGYKGTPRPFELEAVLGAGWWHGYKHGDCGWMPAENSWYTRVGLNFNVNFGSAKQWTAAFKPGIVWDMNGSANDVDRKASKSNHSAFNANHAMVELQLGITYHFKNSNGTHHFALVERGVPQAEFDALNKRVNELRGALEEVSAQSADLMAQARRDLDAANAKNAQLQKDLDDCMSRPVNPLLIDNSMESIETNVFFAQGKSVVTAAQMPNVERVATFLKNHKDATVKIRGYASPEGSKEINERIARQRAEAVRDLLVKKYKISASRIEAEGMGVGDMFSEPDWNRVSVCYIIAPKAK
ncbi:MAG: OmpA family protein [Muribaculaceae bacterium]|nr:OmpA family protein [Muribaculaceae bacterium]